MSQQSEIEELVKLSYQALDRHLTERSKAIIEKRGWINTVSAMNQVPEVYANMPNVVPQYPPPMPPEFSNQKLPPYDGYAAPGPLFVGERLPGRSASYDAYQPDRHPPNNPSVRRHATPVFIDAELEEKEAPKAPRPEVRFTLPQAHLTSSIPDTPKGAEPSSAKSNVSTAKMDDEYMKLRQKLDHLNEKKEAAAKSGDNTTAADITYYAIPDLKVQIEKLRRQQDEEKKKMRAAQGSRVKKDRRRSYHTEVKTESEPDEDEDESKVQDWYDLV